MTKTTPRRRTMRQLSHIFLTEGLTFIIYPKKIRVQLLWRKIGIVPLI